MLFRLISNWLGESREKRRRQSIVRGFEAQAAGNLRLAIECFDRAVALGPERADTRCLLGNALKLSGENVRALAELRAAVRADRNSMEAHLLLASVLPLPDARDEAVATLRRALELGDDSPAQRLNYQLACLLRDVHEYEDAAIHFERALTVHGDAPEWDIESQFANVLHAMGMAEEARARYAHACAISPTDVPRIRRVSIFPPLPSSRSHIDRIRIQFIEEANALLGRKMVLGNPESDITHTDFYLAYHGLDDRPLKELLARMYESAYPDLHHVEPGLLIGAHPGGRVRLGVVSKHLNVHTIGRMMLGFFRHHDRAKLEVTSFMFEEPSDEVAREISTSSDKTVILRPVLEEARRQIAEAKLDVLFYPDIGMNPFTYFLAFARLAPLQFVSWGHPVTTGLPEIDFFISSTHVEPPESAAHYSERLICLPESSAFVSYPKPADIGVMPGRAHFSIPEDVNLYFCPQTLFKMHPDFDDLIGEILRADRKGLLLLIDNPKYFKAQLLGRWAGRLNDVVSRIRFLPVCPHADYLALLGLADVVLDTPHFSGGNSSLEAFAMGAPVVTLPGAYARSRFTYASYSRMGVMDCVARDDREYVGLAIRLGTDRGHAAAMRRRIIKAGAAIYDDLGTVRAMENVFLDAVQQLLDGKLEKNVPQRN